MIFIPLLLNNKKITTVVEDPETGFDWGNSSVMFTGAQSGCGEFSQGPLLYGQKSEWYDGQTYFCYVGPYNADGDSMGYYIKYDEDNGVYRPYRINVANSLSFLGTHDTHPLPALKLSNSGVPYMFQEYPHDTPIRIYTGFNSPTLLAERVAPGTGANAELSYPQLFKDWDGNGVMLCRMTQLYVAYAGGHLAVVRASADLETWGAPFRLTTNPRPVTVVEQVDGATRHYPVLPFYKQRASGYTYFSWVQRTDDAETGLGRWNKYYVARTPETADYFVDIENLTGTPHTHDMTGSNYITETIADTHFSYYATSSEENNAFTPVCTIDDDGNFYSIHGQENTGVLLLTTIISRTKTTIPLDIDGYAVSNPSVSQDHSVKHIIYIDGCLEIDIMMGNYPSRRLQKFRTYNNGATWINYGDLAPDIPNETKQVIYPCNLHDIPENRNFIVAILNEDTVTVGRANIFIKRVAKGSIQAESPTVVSPASSYSDANNVLDYRFLTGDLTKSGNNITGITDQFGLRNATGVNNPQWNGSDAVVFNGTTHKFTIPTTGLTALSKLYISCIVKGPLVVFSMSNNAVTGAYFYCQAGATGGLLIAYKEASGSALFEDGLSVANDGNFNLIEFLAKGNTYDMYINGKKEYYRSIGYSTQPQYLTRGSVGFGTPNAITIGSVDKSASDTYHAGELKRLIIKNTIYDYETQRSFEKKLANDYSITLDYGYQ